MTFKTCAALLAGAFLASILWITTGAAPLLKKPQDQTDRPGAAEMAAMMKQAEKFTQPSEKHELLKRFLGTWDTEMSFVMGGRKSPPERGESTFSWLIEGRWLQQRSTGSMMGMPYEGYMIVGYDNFKMSYVSCMVTSVDTAMTYSEGDVDPRTGALVSYGTLDEYLTGEHDKMVKYVTRFPSEDEMVVEVHDLSIGESNTQVIEIRYKKRGS